MIFENVAPIEVANKNLNDIYSMFEGQHCGGSLWESLDKQHKRHFCELAGMPDAYADLPLSDLNGRERKALFDAIRDSEKVAKQFSAVPFCNFR